jgi:hypothetical protein
MPSGGWYTTVASVPRPLDYTWVKRNFMAAGPIQVVNKDVSNIPDEQLSEILDDLHQELIPEDF